MTDYGVIKYVTTNAHELVADSSAPSYRLSRRYVDAEPQSLVLDSTSLQTLWRQSGFRLSSLDYSDKWYERPESLLSSPLEVTVDLSTAKCRRRDQDDVVMAPSSSSSVIDLSAPTDLHMLRASSSTTTTEEKMDTTEGVRGPAPSSTVDVCHLGNARPRQHQQHQLWLAKSPKSYWLRRHSDSLLVQSADSWPNPRTRSHGVDTDSNENNIDFDAPKSGHDVNANPGRHSSTCDYENDDDDDVFDDVVDREAAAELPFIARCRLSSSPFAEIVTTNRSPLSFPERQRDCMDEPESAVNVRSPLGQKLIGDERSSASDLPRIVEEDPRAENLSSSISSMQSFERQSLIIDYSRLQPAFVDLDSLNSMSAIDSYSGGVIRSPGQLSSSSSSSSSSSAASCRGEIEPLTDGRSRQMSVRFGDGNARPGRRSRHGVGATSEAVVALGHHRQPVEESGFADAPTSSAGGTAVAATTSGTKLHRCTVCRRSFARSDMLERHARLHTGVRPYACRLCAQVFSRSDHLTTHLRTHTGEKPYHCPRCSYSASRRDMVTRHLRVHVHDVHASCGRGSGGNDDESTVPLVPVTVDVQLTSRRRQPRSKNKDRRVDRIPPITMVTYSASDAASSYASSMPSLAWEQTLPTPTLKRVPGDAQPLPASARGRPPWMSTAEHHDDVVATAVESWTRSMVMANCLGNPTSRSSPPSRIFTSASATGAAAVETGLPLTSRHGLSLILARGSTGSTDSYGSPGCCSVPGSAGEVFEFSEIAEGSADVFRSPVTATRQSLKFLWPLVSPVVVEPAADATIPS